MLPADRRPAIKTSLMSDARVAHYWDGEQLIGKWFAVRGGEPGKVAWDIYFLYDKDAEWDPNLESVKSWGRPIIKVKDKLEADFLKLVQ